MDENVSTRSRFFGKKYKYCFYLLTSIYFSNQYTDIVNFFSTLFDVIITFSIFQFSLNSNSTDVKDIFTFVLILLVSCKGNNNSEENIHVVDFLPLQPMDNELPNHAHKDHFSELP